MSDIVTAVPPSAIIAAWADLANWVANTLPTQARTVTLPIQNIGVPPVGACTANEGPPGPNQPTCYANGNGTVTLTQLAVTGFGGAAIQPATVNPATGAVRFPVSFSSIVVDGQYSYNQPCTCSYMKAHSSSSAGSNGSVTQSVSNNTLVFNAQLQPSGVLTLTGVTVNGVPTVSMNPDTGLPGWVSAFINFVSGNNMVLANLQASLSSVFASAPFAQQMIQLVNSALKPGQA